MGLHTRPCTEIVKCAAEFSSEVFLRYRSCSVTAKSILEILILAAEKGAMVTVEAVGEDAEEAVAALLALAKERFYMKY